MTDNSSVIACVMFILFWGKFNQTDIKLKNEVKRNVFYQINIKYSF